MKSNAENLRIGDLAGSLGLPPHVLRYWEAVGLLRPDRVEGNRRVYRRDDLYRVAAIVRAKEAGLSLAEIREMLTTTDPAVRRRVLQRQRAALDERIASLEACRALVDRGLACDHEDFTECPTFEAGLAELLPPGH